MLVRAGPWMSASEYGIRDVISIDGNRPAALEWRENGEFFRALLELPSEDREHFMCIDGLRYYVWDGEP